MGRALDLVEQFLTQAQHDGSLFLDQTLDIFATIAAEQPLFAEWRRYTMSDDAVLSPDGLTRHLVWKLALAELQAPTDATNIATREKCIEYLEVQCVAALTKMHDPRLALCGQLSSTDGEYSFGKSEQAHQDLLGCHATNDNLAESVFGTYDMILRRCPGISMEAASGVAQAVRSMLLSFGDQVAHRKASCKKEEKDFVGWFYRLPEREQEALVELARTTVKEMRDIDRGDHRQLDEYHKVRLCWVITGHHLPLLPTNLALTGAHNNPFMSEQARRKKNEEDELDELFTQYALALSFFERWCKRGVETVGAITTTLNGYHERTQVATCGALLPGARRRESALVAMPFMQRIASHSPCSPFVYRRSLTG